MCAAPLRFEDAKVDMRVQDYWGRLGTIRWIGKIDKKDLAPHRETGRYYGIEYDEESENPYRGSGTWAGKKYFECPAKKGMLCKPHDIYPEISPKCVKLLRARFGDKVASWHDFELVKFCIARRFEMEKVYEMLEKHLAWRAEFQPSWEEYFPQTMVEDYPCGYTGTADYDENLIYCERPGNAGHCHPSDFVRKYTLPTIARWHASGVEMGIRRMRASNYHYKRVCYVVDLLNVNAMTRPMIGFAQTLATVEQDNYPENLGRVFIVNCPAFFRFAWKLVKIFIDDRTNKKINFAARDRAVEIMKECMPEEEIPSFCGGTSEKWMETNKGMVGSSDPAKAFSGTGSNPQATAPGEGDQLEDDNIEVPENADQRSSPTASQKSPSLKSSRDREDTTSNSPKISSNGAAQ